MKKTADRKFWTGIVTGALIAVGLIVVPDLVVEVVSRADKPGEVSPRSVRG